MAINPESCERTPQQKSRVDAVIDLLYINNLFWLYLFSFIYPLFGIIYGVILYNNATSHKTPKIARICIILGAINLALTFAFIILIFAATNFFTHFFKELSPRYL